MKKNILLSSLAISIFIFGCKKTPTDDILPTESTPISIQKADDASAKNELDNINDDIEKIYKSDDYAAARTDGNPKVVLPCGKFTLNGKDFKISYNDTTCGTKVKSGSIDVKLIKGVKFADPSAVLEVTFNEYKVFYNASQTSVTYNGKQTITNVTGGKFSDLYNADTIVHSVRGELTLRFDSISTEGESKIWHIFRKKTFISNGTPAGLSFTLDGDTIMDGKKVIEYGTNKNNFPFVNEMTTPFHWDNCGTTYEGPYTLKAGEVNHTATNKTVLATFTGHFRVNAGYAISTGTLAFDGTCSSAGYKLSMEYKKNGISFGTPRTWFQEY
jgi:hypothetical protein